MLSHDLEHRQRQLSGYAPAFLAKIDKEGRLEKQRLVEQRIAFLRREAADAKDEILIAKREKAEAREKREREEYLAQMRRNGMPQWVRDLVDDVCDKRGRDPALVAGRSRHVDDVAARNEILYRIKATKPELSFSKISGWFGRDHTTVMYSVARHASVSGAPHLTNYDLDGVRLTAQRRQYHERKKNAALAESGK